MMEYISNGIKQTEKIAREFAKTLKKGDVVALKGDLGVGKTVFANFVVKELIGKKAISPTFTILNVYSGDIEVYHFDMYRLKDEEELFNIGYEEYFFGKGITLVEWSERIPNLMPKKHIVVDIARHGEKSRRIVIGESK